MTCLSDHASFSGLFARRFAALCGNLRIIARIKGFWQGVAVISLWDSSNRNRRAIPKDSPAAEGNLLTIQPFLSNWPNQSAQGLWVGRCALVGAGDRDFDHFGATTGADGADPFLLDRRGGQLFTKSQKTALVHFDNRGHSVITGAHK